MRLLFDVGNTRVKWAVEGDGKLDAVDAFVHAGCDLAKIREQLDSRIQMASVDSVWLSCVGSESISRLLEQWVSDRFGLTINLVKVAEQACDITNNYADISKLGVDRWVAALGVREFVASGDVLIIDAGTAITIDVLDADNVFQGGVILPGMVLMHDSLIGRTAGIESQLSGDVKLIGRTTQECVNSGVRRGVVGAVEKVVFEMRRYLQNETAQANSPSVLIAGGDADLIKQNSSFEYQSADNLVLRGLATLAKA